MNIPRAVHTLSFDVFGRWLLPLIAIVALCASSTMGWASAGPTTTAACCCPAPDACRCHEQKSTPDASRLERCHGGVMVVAPSIPVAIVEVAILAATVRAVTTLPPPSQPPLSDQYIDEPETPPF